MSIFTSIKYDSQHSNISFGLHISWMFSRPTDLIRIWKFLDNKQFNVANIVIYDLEWWLLQCEQAPPNVGTLSMSEHALLVTCIFSTTSKLEELGGLQQA